VDSLCATPVMRCSYCSETAVQGCFVGHWIWTLEWRKFETTLLARGHQNWMLNGGKH
jgi:hypothetical protein